MHCKKLVIIFNIMRQELWKNRVIITNNISLLWYMFMLKSPRIYISLSIYLSIWTFSKVMFKISRKLVWLGGLYIIAAFISMVLGNRISKKMFSITFEKVFLHVTNITSYIARNTSTVSVSVHGTIIVPYSITSK